ncbi:MAG: hypothetical protein FWB78_12970 [Treponema sp.]|nr:hypothetical protein [Treponema sp.]
MKQKALGQTSVTLALALALALALIGCPTSATNEAAPAEIAWTATPSGSPTNVIVLGFDAIPPSNSKLQILRAKRANSVGFATKTSLFLSFSIGRKSQSKGEIRG